MERFHLYAGLGGGFGGARYNQTIEAEDIDETFKFACGLAIKEYQPHESWIEYYAIKDENQNLKDY